MFFPKRTADTYDANTSVKTHRTEMVDKGISFPEHLAETRRTEGGEKRKTVTRIRDKGIVSLKKVASTDKE